MDRLLRLILQTVIRRGSLRVTTAGGSTFTLGDGSGTPVALRFLTMRAQWGVVLDPELRLGEAYMNGGLTLEQGTIADLLRLGMRPDAMGHTPPWARAASLFRYLLRRFHQLNRAARAYPQQARR